MALVEILSLSAANPLVHTLAVSVFRSLFGWLENAIKDGKVEMFEVQQLGATFFRVLVQGLGLTAFGIPAEGAFITDFVISKAWKSSNGNSISKPK